MHFAMFFVWLFFHFWYCYINAIVQNVYEERVSIL